MFTALVATWEVTAGNPIQSLSAMPESLGMVVWGVSLLMLAGVVRHRATRNSSADQTARVRPVKSLGITARRLLGNGQELPCPSER